MTQLLPLLTLPQWTILTSIEEDTFSDFTLDFTLDTGANTHVCPNFTTIAPTPTVSVGPTVDMGPDYLCVGAGLGGGFDNTNELHVMTYSEAMSKPDWAEWEKSVDKEHERMTTNHVFKRQFIRDIPEWATVLSPSGP